MSMRRPHTVASSHPATANSRPPRAQCPTATTGATHAGITMAQRTPGLNDRGGRRTERHVPSVRWIVSGDVRQGNWRETVPGRAGRRQPDRLLPTVGTRAETSVRTRRVSSTSGVCRALFCMLCRCAYYAACSVTCCVCVSPLCVALTQCPQAAARSDSVASPLVPPEASGSRTRHKH